MSTLTRYDTIGADYSRTRNEDPYIRQRLHEGLGDGRTIVNVGAGTGSYEPSDRHVIAIEPSDVMAAQRSKDRVPAIRGVASALPLRDGSVDAAMAVLTIHHWEDCEQGIRELRRVARQRVVILTYDPTVSTSWWLMKDYAPEIGQLDRECFPAIDDVTRWLDASTEVRSVLIPRDCEDWMLGSFWAHPERVLDPAARAATSGFARLDQSVQDRIVVAVSKDLKSGVWDERYASLRTLEAFDSGLRLVVAAVENEQPQSSEM